MMMNKKKRRCAHHWVHRLKVNTNMFSAHHWEENTHTFKKNYDKVETRTKLEFIFI